MSAPDVTVRPLAELTTLRVGGPAEIWTIESDDQLPEATAAPYRVLGNGSNLLVSDEGVAERVLKLGRSYDDGRSFGGEPDVWLGAATPLPGLVRRAKEAGLSGLEGTLGVPAVLGGAIAMNAGTRFGEIGDVLEEVELFTNGDVVRLPASELHLAYRASHLPEGAVILRARLRLTPSTPERVAAAMAEVDAARKGQPKAATAGCAFKNPPEGSAGRLIDEAGLKGLRVGDAMISHEHGNFVVNLGNASERHVRELLDRVRHAVGIPLEMEWRAWGDARS